MKKHACFIIWQLTLNALVSSIEADQHRHAIPGGRRFTKPPQLSLLVEDLKKSSGQISGLREDSDSDSSGESIPQFNDLASSCALEPHDLEDKLLRQSLGIILPRTLLAFLSIIRLQVGFCCFFPQTISTHCWLIFFRCIKAFSVRSYVERVRSDVVDSLQQLMGLLVFGTFRTVSGVESQKRCLFFKSIGRLDVLD